MASMAAVVRDIEPWDDLLAAGRSDERLVMQAAENRRPAREVAIPEELHPDVVAALRGARDRAAVVSSGRGPARRLGGPDDPHHRYRVGQVAGLQPAGARRALPRRRARGRSTSTRPRRSPRTRRGRSTRSASSARGRRSTTATPRASSAPRSASAPTSCSPTPTCCTWGSFPTTRPGRPSSRTWRWWSSTRRTSTAACSAPTSPTSCAACAGSPPRTGPSRGSSWPARRSPTPASWPSG